jgi:hypothetical protein
MKKILLIASIVLLFLSCDTDSMEKEMTDPVTINFETNGGEPVNPIVFDRETTHEVNLPTPKKQGYEFEAWYTDEGLSWDKKCDGDKLFISQVLYRSEITLYARFVKYYDVEISDISCVIDYETGLATFSWEIPDDENFSQLHFGFGREFEIQPYDPKPGDTEYIRRVFYPNIPEIPRFESILIRCVDKDGNFSKGITYTFHYD